MNVLFSEKETSKIAFNLRDGQFCCLSMMPGCPRDTYKGCQICREPRELTSSQKTGSTYTYELHHFSIRVGQTIALA